MLDQTATIQAYLAATAARQPTPGGGSVAALTGALAAALAEMAVNYSIGKKDLADFQPQLKQALAQLTRARLVLTELMAEDQDAFTVLSAARKLAENTPKRKEIIAAALAACIGAPQAVAATALATLELCEQILPAVNPHLLSDLAIAADLATATVRCAIYNVKINLPDVPDAGARATIDQETHHTLVRTLAVIQRLSPAIWKRQQPGG
ncbi:MAG: cyclodeaminase/cyclohydrolase family protein [Tepidisphaeraceae bacterium]